MADYDLAIIGGGINGTASRATPPAAALRVLLVEQNDLASGTSSAFKADPWRLRYLEHGAFRLVREALNEREVLLRMAPHVIRPLRFVLPLCRACARAVLRLGPAHLRQSWRPQTVCRRRAPSISPIIRSGSR